MHASTFGGNPIACRAALAAIDTIEEDNLLQRGTAIGERLPSPGSDIEWEEGAGPDEIAALAEKEFFEPNLYLYDSYPGGIGFSEPLYRAHALLLAKTRELIAACPCESGCPSCVGPAGERGERAKDAALAILTRLSA